MHRKLKLLTGTALCALIATSYAGAGQSTMPLDSAVANGEILVAQADCATSADPATCLAEEAKKKLNAGGAQEPAATPEPEAKPEPVATPEPAVEPPAKAETQKVEEQAAQPEAEQPEKQQTLDAVEPEEKLAPDVVEKPADAAEKVEQSEAEQPEKPQPTEAQPADKSTPEVVEKPAEVVEPAAETETLAEPVEEVPTPTPSPELAEDPAEKDEPAETVEEKMTEPAPEEKAEKRRKKKADQDDAAETEAAENTGRSEPKLDDGSLAPVLDSQKNNPQPAETTEDVANDDEPAPQSDLEAQVEITEEVESITAEQGRRIDEPKKRKRERRKDREVVREFDDRIIIRLDGGGISVERREPGERRIGRNAADVYYEELANGRTREVVVRRNGVQVITIRNRYGDILRRSKVFPDGREVILVHVNDRDYDRIRDWRDPGRQLPPMRLRIPVRDYILDARTVDDRDTYYEFLSQPPVEKVEQTYSLVDVKRSSRIRDKVRRIDLDTINFEFGSASISESEIPALEDVAYAIERLLEKNPGESFLIEGHTDAVGSDLANLALSDQRAETVVDALTNVFGIPPENLVPQGYGEEYLKVNTLGRSRENRRVAIRRITALVAPVARNN